MILTSALSIAVRLLPLAAAVLTPVLLAAGVAWLTSTASTAARAQAQTDSLVKLLRANRTEARRLASANRTLRISEQEAQATAARAREEAATARARIASLPPSGAGVVCPTDCILPSIEDDP